MASWRFPSAARLAFPEASPHILMAYANIMSSEEDSWSLPSTEGKRPLAKEWPW